MAATEPMFSHLHLVNGPRILGKRTSNLVRHLHKGFLPTVYALRFGRQLFDAAAEAARFGHTAVDRPEGFLVLAIASLGDKVTELTSPPEEAGAGSAHYRENLYIKEILYKMEKYHEINMYRKHLPAKLNHRHRSNADGNGDWVLTISIALSLPSATKKFERHLSTCVKVLEMTGLKLLHLNRIKLLTVISSVDDMNYPGRTALAILLTPYTYFLHAGRL
ncbi:hypothetical protein Tco_0810114 [Tanacetum coccineum]